MTNIYKKVAPQATHEKFISDMKSKNIVPKKVDAYFPYHDNPEVMAYIVDFNDKTFYFSFSGDGHLLQKKIE